MLDDELFRSILNIGVFLWLLGWAVKGARRLFSSGRDSVCFIFPTHFALCGVPLFLDEAMGKTNYRFWPGFDIAAADGESHVAYCLYVAACPLIWWYFGRSKATGKSAVEVSGTAMSLRSLSWQGKTVLHLLLFGPLLALYLAPHPAIYADYAAIMRGTLGVDDLAYHPILTATTLVSSIAGAALLFSQRRLKLTCLYVLPFAVLAAWLDGKRTVVLIVCVMFGIALWSRGALKRRTVLLVAPALMAGFIFFSVSYQSGLRGLDTFDAAKRYDNIRLDYGRDHIIRMALYCELHPEAPPMLEYRLQTLLFDSTMLVPREIWPDKPWPYAIYATAAALRTPVRSLGWGVTTSLLDEAIANFGWMGLLAGPLLLALVCRIGDAPGDSILRLLTVLLSSMLLAVQIAAFAPLVAIWVLTLFVSRRARRSRAVWSLAVTLARVRPLTAYSPINQRVQI